MYKIKGKRFLMLLTSISLIVGSVGISQAGFAEDEITDEALEKIYAKVWNFDYTGKTEKFIAPMAGSYKVQLWGAKGGEPSDGIVQGGRGAYVEGIVNLLEGEELNVNVGEYPGMRSQGGFNGGGNGYINPDNQSEFGAGGGGATDVRKGNVKQAVAAGGAGGGIIHFGSSSHNADKAKASQSGSGGKEIGQLSGSAHETSENLGYSGATNYRSGGGTQSKGGVAFSPPENSQTLSGTLGKGGDGYPGVTDQYPYFTVSSYGGGGGAGYYGGAGGFYRGNGSVPSGGGGSSYIANLEKNRIKNWLTGWDTQPSYTNSIQDRNHDIEKHGYVKITKANEPPNIRLKSGFENGKSYKSMETYKNTVAIKDRDFLGGNVTIWSTVKIGNNMGTPVNHGEHFISIEERDVDIDIFIPEHPYATSTTGEIKIWAVDKEGLKAVEISRTIGVEIPNYTKIEVIPSGKNWYNGSYNAKIILTDNFGIQEAKVLKDNKIIANTGNLSKETYKKEIIIPITENKSINLEIKNWKVSGYTQRRVVHFNNLSNLQNIERTQNEIKYEIKNYGILEDLTQWEIVTLDETQEYTGSFSRKTEKLKPNEKVKIRYKLFDLESKEEINGGWTPYQTIHSLSQNAEEGKLISYNENSAEFTFKPNKENSEKPMYQFRAIQTSMTGTNILDEKRSVKVEEGTTVNIKGLLPNTEYRVETTTFNGDDIGGDAVNGGWTHLKDETGKTIVFKTKGDLNFKFDSIGDWINEFKEKDEKSKVANLTGSIKLNSNQKIAMYINIGSNNRLKVSDDMTAKSDETVPYNIEIRKKKTGQNIIYKDNTKTNAINQYILELNMVDGKYNVWIETDLEGYRQEHDAGWIGIDTKGPESKSKGIFKQITKDKGILTLPTKDIYDISTPNHEILVDYGMGKMLLFSEKLITYKKPMTIKLYDNLGHESTLAWSHDPNGGYVEGEDNPTIDPPKELDPEYPEGNVVEVDVPKGGTHMQNSLDGVTWSIWVPRKDNVKVALPTGDGFKSVFVRTGQELLKETPVYDVEYSKIEMVKQKGGEISPLNNTRIYNYIVDLTAPKLEIRTVDNMLIAINGNITFLLDVVDNLDQKPKVKIEIMKRNESGALEDAPIFSKEVQLSEGVTTGSITPSKLAESRNSKGKLQPYTLRVTAWDKSNNRTVKHANFYVKNK